MGITVVVQYPDQREPIFEALASRLANGITIGKFEKHENKQGYFAHHASCSKAFAGHELKCEVQVKTMLHDAWSKKMHDLTYKPLGKLDVRLASLMAANAITIESVEQQSILIRDMIMAGWNVEREARLAAQKCIFDNMLKDAKASWTRSASTEFKGLAKKVGQTMRWIAVWTDGDPRRADLLKCIGKAAADPKTVRFAWILAGRLASAKPDRELVTAARMATEQWIRALSKPLATSDVASREVTAIPLIFYAMGELRLSVEYADKLLEEPGLDLAPRTKAILLFNRANSLVEIEYHTPSNPGHDRDKLEQELLETIDNQELGLIEDIESSILDLHGLIDVTFAKDTQRVMQGISRIAAAVDRGVPKEKILTEAYAHLNMRRAWRRFFEVEVEERTDTGRSRPD